MSFYNKKEEVLDIVLTRFGRETLMKGNFSPVFYRFFDDGIIYDGSWAGQSELQNEIEPRIKEAPMLKTQMAYNGVETSYKRENDTKDVGNSSIEQYFSPLYSDQDETEGINSLKHALYSSRVGTQKTPQFTAKCLTGQFEGNLTYSTGSGENIPQASLEFKGFTVLTSEPSILPEDILGDYESFAEPTQLFSDGTLMTSDQEWVYLSFDETEVPLSEGFELEVFEEISGSLVPLYFNDPGGLREVGDYFELIFDEEVDPTTLFPGHRVTPASMFAREAIVAPDLTLRKGQHISIYNSLPDDSDVEDCD